MKNNKLKVFVGVSGGVDSSVALALLQKQGYDVTGVFLKVWSPDFLPCDWKEERRSAMRVCATLGVPFLTLDCEAEYKKEVVDYMIREYREGRVPNPDVFCNKYVKFGIFLQKALEMGADFVATGHYAVVEKKLVETESFLRLHSRVGETEENRTNDLSVLKKDSGEKEVFQLLESRDKEKDQSYFLYTLGQHELSHALFPVGGMTKPEVRKLAHSFSLPTAEKKDSQGLCFIGKVDMKDFLSHYIPKKRGDVLNTDGKVVGYHDGAVLYAIGERHGFTITKKSSEDPRFFVVSKNMQENTITVAGKKEPARHSDVAGGESDAVFNTKEIIIKDLHFISGKESAFPLKTSVRIRYHQQKQSCMIDKKSDGYYVTFDTPQNAISVGQSAVFYDGEICLGGGIIEKCI